MIYNNKSAFITGASSGIGAGFARELHRRGCNVILTARRKDRLASLATELNASRANSAEYFVADLSSDRCNDSDADLATLPQLLDFISGKKIDILINNAGLGSFGEFDLIPLKRELEIVATNIAATVQIAHAVIPQMKNQKEGAIICLSSIVGFLPSPYMATYSASKAFNLTHSLALRHELSAYGIRVLAVCPGPTETEFSTTAQVSTRVSNLFRGGVEQVILASLSALETNKAFVVPGLENKIPTFFGRLLPLNLRAWITGKILKHQQF